MIHYYYYCIVPLFVAYHQVLVSLSSAVVHRLAQAHCPEAAGASTT